MREKELKPCPFCGGKAFLKDGKPKTFGTFEALVICTNCSASVVGVSRINFATHRFGKARLDKLLDTYFKLVAEEDEDNFAYHLDKVVIDELGLKFEREEE